MKLVPRLKRYFEGKPGVWVPGGEIERLVEEHTDYTASNARRRLRELVEDGFLEQKEERRNGRNHAYYKLKGVPAPRIEGQVVVMDGRAVFVTS